MNQLKIELNCDMGESYGRYRIGNDAAIMPYINSCNLACGYHAGDPLTIQKTIDLAIQHQVKIGAHPSYTDLSGFGRRGEETRFRLGRPLRFLFRTRRRKASFRLRREALVAWTGPGRRWLRSAAVFLRLRIC